MNALLLFVAFFTLRPDDRPARKPEAPANPAAGPVVVLISADAEWRALRQVWPQPAAQSSPFGEWIEREVGAGAGRRLVIVFHGGWGKIAAAASTQYAIDRWRPRRLVNVGTCGGFRGRIERGEVVLVDRTVVYDIVEQMGDAAEAVAAYATDLDVSWAGSDLPSSSARWPGTGSPGPSPGLRTGTRCRC